METKYIKFWELQVPTKTRTTLEGNEKVERIIAHKRIWIVTAKQRGADFREGGEELGKVDWFELWHCYMFYPSSGTVYDASSMRELADFCDEETKIRRLHKC